MKKAIILCIAAMALSVSSAFAVTGVDLSVGACPLNTGHSNDLGTINCAAGGIITLLVTFEPVETMTDFVGGECALDVVVAGDVGDATGDAQSADFWDFTGSNAGAFSIVTGRPATICSTPAYGNVLPAGSPAAGTWTTQYHNATASDLLNSMSLARAGLPVNINAGSNNFYSQLQIDGSTAIEAGGTAHGCSKGAKFSATLLILDTSSGSPTTPLTTGGNGANSSIANGGATPTTRHTWGQLKSLYR